MVNIAIIPARSGSKGLKDKNIINLMGKPMIAYTIQAAINSGCFESVYVSTDSLEYAELSKEYGAKVIIRDYELSNDNATTFMVVEHSLNILKNQKIDVESFALLQPTSPLRNSHHIKEAYKIFYKSQKIKNFVVSMTKSSKSSNLIHSIEDGTLVNFNSDYKNYKRQAYEEYYPNGAIFIANASAYLKKGDFFGSHSSPYIMSEKDSSDIDTIFDFQQVINILVENQSKEQYSRKISKAIVEKNKINTARADLLFFGHSVLNNYPEPLFFEMSISNWGISGSTTKEMFLKVIEQNLILNKYKSILIMLGINDIKLKIPIEDFKEYYDKILCYFIKNNKESILILSEIMHTNGNVFCSNDEIDRYNKVINLLAKKYNLNVFSWKSFENNFGKVYYKYSNDGIHLTNIGYKLMDKELIKLYQRKEK